MKYTKILALLCAAATVTSVMSSCGEKNDSSSSKEKDNTSQTSDDKENNDSEQAESEYGKFDKEVVFSEESGIFDKEFDLAISCDGAEKILYTTDGSNPATSKTAQEYSADVHITDRKNDKNYVSAVDTALYDGANVQVNSSWDGFDTISQAPSDAAVDKTTVIRAVAQNSDGDFSKIYTGTYFIGTMEEHIAGITESCEAAGYDLAVVSLSVDYDDLFDAEKGIYVKGNIFDKAVADLVAGDGIEDAESARKLDANYRQKGKEWERNCHIDFFEANGDGAELGFSQDCGIRIQGNYSRSDLVKGFRLYARDEYGAKNFKYPVFGSNAKNDSGETLEKFKTLTLRAGGNTAFSAKFNDTYWQTLLAQTDVETQTSRPCVVYLDGEYWGLYVLQEDYSENYFEDTHGVDKNQVIVYKGDAEALKLGYKLDEGKLPEGESNESYYFNDLLTFFKNNKNLSDETVYAEFEKLVDTQSLIDYFACEVWINNKWDWPGKNWSMWKTAEVDPSNEYADGKWRFMFYDMEFGGVSGKQDCYTNTIKEDNYKQYGLLDTDTDNPAVLCYAYAMTNESFRTAFCERLEGLSDTLIEREKALELLGNFQSTYEPLYDQFFERYPNTGSADEAVNGGYSSVQCIKDFLDGRADNIDQMIDYVNEHFE